MTHKGIELTGKTLPGIIDAALKEAKACGMSQEHIKKLRGVLKVAKRNVKFKGGSVLPGFLGRLSVVGSAAVAGWEIGNHIEDKYLNKPVIPPRKNCDNGPTWLDLIGESILETYPAIFGRP